MKKIVYVSETLCNSYLFTSSGLVSEVQNVFGYQLLISAKIYFVHFVKIMTTG